MPDRLPALRLCGRIHRRTARQAIRMSRSPCGALRCASRERPCRRGADDPEQRSRFGLPADLACELDQRLHERFHLAGHAARPVVKGRDIRPYQDWTSSGRHLAGSHAATELPLSSASQGCSCWRFRTSSPRKICAYHPQRDQPEGGTRQRQVGEAGALPRRAGCLMSRRPTRLLSRAGCQMRDSSRLKPTAAGNWASCGIARHSPARHPRASTAPRCASSLRDELPKHRHRAGQAPFADGRRYANRAMTRFPQHWYV